MMRPAKQTNIEIPENDECAFCAYIRGDRPYTIVRRTSETITMVTREQRGIAHLLIAPLRHEPTILGVENSELAAIAVAVRHAASMIDAAFSPPGIAVWQNNGSPAGQVIAHVHFHVAGTLPEGGTKFGKVPEISVKESDEIAERLRLAERLIGRN